MPESAIEKLGSEPMHRKNGIKGIVHISAGNDELESASQVSQKPMTRKLPHGSV